MWTNKQERLSLAPICQVKRLRIRPGAYILRSTLVGFPITAKKKFVVYKAPGYISWDKEKKVFL
jgi:hypothetical protein